MANKPLTFYDVKAKKKFTTSDYEIVVKKTKKGKVKMAKAKSPYSNIYAYRILGRA